MNTKDQFVITISREVGSGGHTIGKIIAQKLRVPYYDKSLVRTLTNKFDMSVYELEKIKGQKKNWLSEFLSSAAPLPAEMRNKSTDQAIFKAEEEFIEALAAEGSCVIAGRSGFHILKDHPNALHVFITASEEYRIKRVMAKQNLAEEGARALIKDIDGKRDNYIKRFAGVDRNDADNYHLCIKADGLSEEKIADFIISYIEQL